MASDDVMTNILDWFFEFEEWLPGVHSLVGEILLGPIPASDAAAVYDLAETWGLLAQELTTTYEDVLHAADGILESWRGDGAAQAFSDEWFAYLETLRSVAESAGALQEGVQSFGLQVELMKFMAALNLVLLAVSLIMLVVAAIPSGGASLGAAVPVVGATGTAIRIAASKTIGTIAGLVMRMALKAFTATLGRALPALARAAIPAVVRTALPRIATVAVTRAVPAVVRRVLPDIARRVVARGISRSVANRMAAQALRTEAGHALRRGVAGQSMRAVQNQLARELEEQLLRRFTNRAASEVVGEGAEALIRRFAIEQAANASLRHELTRFVGSRMLIGAGFMGGGNFAGQAIQMMQGDRAAMDWGQVMRGSLEGAAFGAGMWGGPVGHVVGGTVAGATVGAAYETYDYFTAPEGSEQQRFDWGAVGHSAFQGGLSGIVAGAETRMETARIGGGNVRIGEDVRLLPNADGSFTISARDVNVSPTHFETVGHGVLPGHGLGGGDLGNLPPGHTGADGGDLRPDLGGAARGGDGASLATAPPPAHTPTHPAPPSTGAAGPSSGSTGGGGTGAGGRGGDAGPRVRVPVEGGAPVDGAPPRSGVDGGPPPGDRVPSTGDGGPPVRADGDGGPPVRADGDGGPPVRADGDGGPAPVRTDGGGPPPVRADGDGSPAPTRADAPPPATRADAPPPAARADAPPPAARADAPPPASRADAPPPAARADAPPPAARADAAPPARSTADAPPVRAGDGHIPAQRAPSDGVPADRTPSPAARADGDGTTQRDTTPTRDGPPPDGTPTRADGDAHAHHLASAGAEDGLPPSPETIRQGTVRMEDHPDYPAAVRRLEEQGFRVVPADDGPRVAIREVRDASGQNVLRVEQEVRVREGMRWLDFEHELGHVDQVRDPARFPDGPPHTEVVRERPNGSYKEITNAPGRMPRWQDSVAEYHVRLQEYIRLHERGVDPAILDRHAEGVDFHRGRYEQDVTRQRFEPQRAAWARDRFGDIPELQRRYEDLRGGGRDSGPEPTFREGRPFEKADNPEGVEGHPDRLPEGARGPDDSGPPPGDRPRDGGGPADRGGDGLEVPRRALEDPARTGGTGPLAGDGVVRGLDRPALVAVDTAALADPVAAPDSVVAALDRHIGDLLANRPPSPDAPPHQPHTATWDPDSRTLRVSYPDGLAVDVVVQVNSALPPGHPTVVRPGIELDPSGAWHQTAPAGVVLPAHVPSESGLRDAFVGRELTDSWRTLHDQFPAAGRSDPVDTLYTAADGGVNPLAGDQIRLRAAEPGTDGGPQPVTPDTVRQALDRPNTPEARWAEQHLGDARTPDAVDAATAALAAEGAAPVQQPGAADPSPPPDPPPPPPPPPPATLPETRVIGAGRLAPIETPEYQRAVQDSLRTPDGTYAVWADPSTHPYGRLVNDGGPGVVGRGNNCLDCSLSALASFRGDPQVSAPRWPDVQDNGSPDLESGERFGTARAQQYLGGQWVLGDTNLPDGYAERAPRVEAQYRALHAEIERRGPGASALVVSEWVARDPDTFAPVHDENGVVQAGGSHAWVVVYPRDASGPVWWDPQSGQAWNEPPRHFLEATRSVWALPVDAGPGGHGHGADPGRSARADVSASQWAGAHDVPVRRGLAGEAGPLGRADEGGSGARAGQLRGGPDGRGDRALQPAHHDDHGAVRRGAPDGTHHGSAGLAAGADGRGGGDAGGAALRGAGGDDAAVRVRLGDDDGGWREPHRGPDRGGDRPLGPVAEGDGGRVRGGPARGLDTWTSGLAPDRVDGPVRLGSGDDAASGRVRLGDEPGADRGGDPYRSDRPDDLRPGPDGRGDGAPGPADRGGDAGVRDGAPEGPDHRSTDLAPDRDLRPVPDDPAGGRHGPDPVEQMWADPPWVRDGRPPSLDELIPHTDVEVDRHAADVRRAMADLLDGRTFAGLSVRLDLTDPNSVSVYRDSVVVRLDVLDRDAGMMVGSTVRSFGRDHDGSLYVEHVSLRLNQQAQGGGFAREWNRFLEDWYRYSGVDHIEVHASSTVGGYAWARAGYDWAPNTEHRANAVLQRLAMQMRQVDNHIADVGRWAAGDSSVDIGALQRRYGAEHPDDLVARMRDEYAAGQDILERARRHPFGSAGYPSPEDVSHAGWDGRTGREAMWIGKEALLGADWKGVKPISETGPLHPRPAGPEITAAAVPESLFHGFARDEPAPDVVSALGHTALASRMSALPPDSALAGVRIELTTVDAHTLPDGAVARSVPVEGGYTIQLSDRASDAAVPRAVAHEIAELTAIRARAAGGLDVSVPDALHPGPHADGAPLSPHDLGRLAEVDQLVPLLADPAHAPHARAELAALRDHLGLRADDPGAAGRRELVDPYVRGAGHDPDTLWGDPAPDPDPRARVDATVDPVSGYELRQRDLDFIGRSEQDLAWLADREAPLGMTPEVYHDWSASLYDALRRDGITPDAVDVRIRGSSVDVYSGRHKVLPTAADLAADPDAAARLQAWLGDDPDRPTSRPFDSMHRLGLEEPSDYDINISSDRMFDQVAARWDADGADGPLRTDHGYLPKRLVRAEFPHVAAWAREWSASLGRDMSYAVFDGHGPRDSTQFGFFVHFHDADFVVRPPETGPAISGPATGGPARPVAPDDTAYRDWSRQESDRIVTDDGRVTTSEAAKTRVIRSVADRMTTPLPRLLAAAAEPHVDPRLAGLLGSPDHVVVLRNPDYPSMGGTLVARDALDPSVPADRLLALDDPAAPRIVREMAVSELIMAWAHDSNGTNVRSLAIQEAAVAEFGLRGHLGWPMSPEVRADVDAAVAAHGDVHRELLRAQYDLTQAELRQRGVNELALYRGYAWDPAQVPDWATVPAGEVVDLPPQRPLSAWTGDRQIAEDWIGSLSRPGVVIAARFPAEAVLAYPQTGVGCLWQREFVVLAGDGRAIMDVVYPGRR